MLDLILIVKHCLWINQSKVFCACFWCVWVIVRLAMHNAFAIQHNNSFCSVFFFFTFFLLFLLNLFFVFFFRLELFSSDLSISYVCCFHFICTFCLYRLFFLSLFCYCFFSLAVFFLICFFSSCWNCYLEFCFVTLVFNMSCF